MLLCSQAEERGTMLFRFAVGLNLDMAHYFLHFTVKEIAKQTDCVRGNGLIRF